MTSDPAEEIGTAALLRGARRVYGDAIRAALDDAGYDDVPRNGIFVLSAISRSGTPLAGVVRDMGISKQSGSQLVDALVLRGYLERRDDPADRRRLTIVPSARGREVAAIVSKTVARMNGVVIRRIGKERMQQMREALLAIIEIGNSP
ncbi:MAG: winged helix-turn-helix transcriptional regulator [Proteobacteria bacterium]|nr:winged helix-turn-helix transcriptional regulator [Pseudomonadota bacterium]